MEEEKRVHFLRLKLSSKRGKGRGRGERSLAATLFTTSREKAGEREKVGKEEGRKVEENTVCSEKRREGLLLLLPSCSKHSLFLFLPSATAVPRETFSPS